MARPFSIGNMGDNVVLFICLALSLTLLLLPGNARILVADRLGMVLTAPYWSVRNFGEDIVDTKAENARLEKQVAELELQMASDMRMVRDAERMAGPALDPGYEGELVPCRVLMRQRGRFATMIKIRSLTPVHWQPWQPVISGSGYLGRIRTVINENEAWVDLLTAPDFAIGVELDRTGLLGVLHPRADRFVLDMVGRDEDVKVGDKVVTSGIAEVREGAVGSGVSPTTPRGFPVGVVVSVGAPSDKIFKEIIVQPSADMERNETVFVMTPFEAFGTDGGTHR